MRLRGAGRRSPSRLATVVSCVCGSRSSPPPAPAGSHGGCLPAPARTPTGDLAQPATQLLAPLRPAASSAERSRSTVQPACSSRPSCRRIAWPGFLQTDRTELSQHVRVATLVHKRSPSRNLRMLSAQAYTGVVLDLRRDLGQIPLRGIDPKSRSSSRVLDRLVARADFRVVTGRVPGTSCGCSMRAPIHWWKRAEWACVERGLRRVSESNAVLSPACDKHHDPRKHQERCDDHDAVVT